MRVLSERDVAALIRPVDAIRLAADAYRLSASSAGSRAVRGDLRAEEPRRGCLLLAGGSAGPAGRGSLSVKTNVHAYPDGPERPRHWGSLLTLWDWEAAQPRALLSAGLFNEHRTAAGFAAAIDRLADPAATTATIVGAGKSAPVTAIYLKTVRPGLERLHLVGRSPARVASLRERLAAEPAFADVALVTDASAAEAVAASGIVVTVTTSDVPVFPGEAARPGSCIVLGGANRPGAREADDALMRRADVFLDALDGAFDKAGDLVAARASGALDPARLRGALGAFETAVPPLGPGADLRVFKSMGLALQDVLLAEALVAAAEAAGVGTLVDLGGER